MIPQTFEYRAPATLKEALALAGNGESKILAGGMSLIPLMKLRLASPAEVVDLGRIPGLNQITEANGIVTIGAMATHHEIESSPVIRAHCPLLAEAASHIGDAQVRNMGTIGGSIAHADPAADYPAPLLALEARLRLVSATSERVISLDGFLIDAFTTALEPGEIIVEVQVPVEESNEGYSYQKVAHPASGFAVVGVAARIEQEAGKITMARIAVTGMAARAFRDLAVEKLLESGAPVAQAVAKLGESSEANSDLYASADYRLHLARTHAARAVAAAIPRIS